MALQVGAFCYASPVEAGRAACSQFQPSTVIYANEVKTVTCSGSDALTGDLLLQVVTTDTATQISTVQNITQSLTFPPCVQEDYIAYFGVIFGGLMAVYVIWLCGRWMLSFLDFNRGAND
ncbi:MAG: hypothetical protein Q8J80_09795 [Gallionella sp.]|nr:hypothetical protein [Gallionella sp.]